MLYNYEKSPSEIYRKSFATICSEANFDRFNENERELVIRLIHACGMVDIAADVVISASAIELGRLALAAGAPIVCDVEMVRRGIISRNLTAKNHIYCEVGSSDCHENSRVLQTTRSAAGIDSLKLHIPGSIVVIGNAPTALFHLLEMIDRGLEAPALIIGCPVGFVGAVESKEALIANEGGIPFISLRGRFGGSAVAAAAVNALAGGLKA